MSKSNPVHLWRFGRTRALIFTQKWLNRAKIGVLHGTPKIFLRPNKSVSRVLKTQLSKINWTIKSISSGLVTRRLYFLKKYDTKWPKFPPCRNWPICDHLSLLGPIGHFRYLWSTVSTSNLSRHGMPSCGWWDTHLCPKAAFPSQGGKDPPSIPSVESIALRPIPWQGQGQGVITLVQRPLPSGIVSKPKARIPIDSISWIDCITSNPMTRSRSRCDHFGPKTFALRHHIQAKGKDPPRIDSIQLNRLNYIQSHWCNHSEKPASRKPGSHTFNQFHAVELITFHPSPG